MTALAQAGAGGSGMSAGGGTGIPDNYPRKIVRPA